MFVYFMPNMSKKKKKRRKEGILTPLAKKEHKCQCKTTSITISITKDINNNTHRKNMGKTERKY